jgi:hypothetical protein
MSKNISVESLKRKLVLMRKNLGKIYKIWFNDCLFEIHTDKVLKNFDPIFGSRYDFVTRVIDNDYRAYICTSRNATPKELYEEIIVLSHSIIVNEVMES